MRRKVLITGITGQDGSYLAELLLEKNYEVHGIKRRSSSGNTVRIEHLLSDIQLHDSDMTDGPSLNYLIKSIKPDEVYNLAAQSHVKTSWDCPEFTANTDGLGTLRLLEGIRSNGLAHTTRFYQASTSELYGLIQQRVQDETTPFYPRSPYAVAKLYAYWITKNYRESFGMFACNGILFNHESPRRGDLFVTRKITKAVAKIANGLQEILFLGNLNAKRDWGHARDYVDGMWRMLQQPIPKDYVLSTGNTTSIRDFATMAFECAGMKLKWEGTGLEEIGVDSVNKKIMIRVDPRLFRPAEVDLLIGNSSLAQEELNWKSTYTLKQICKEMVDHDIKLILNEAVH